MSGRIAQGAPVDLELLLTADGDPIDADSTVEVVVTDMLNVEVASANADHPGVGEYRLPLDGTDTAALGPIVATWTFALGGRAATRRTYHEIVGEHLFPLAELRALPGLENATKYPDAALEDARDLATYSLEDACRTAFTPRAALYRDTTARGHRLVALPYGRIISVDGVTTDAGALTVDELPAVLHEGGGLLSRSLGFGSGAVSIRFTYGYPSPPARIVHAAKLLARDYLERHRDVGVPDRATSYETGEATYRMVTAGVGGAAFSIPEVNAAVNLYRE